MGEGTLRIGEDTGRRTLSVLVVDDELPLRTILSAYLARLGHRCRTAVDGEEALEALRGEPADVIFTDIRMPRLDGVGLIQRARAAGVGSEIVVMSSYLDIAKAVIALRHGVCDLIEKPFGLARIDEALQVALGRIEVGRTAGAAAKAPAAAALVGDSAATRGVLDMVARVGPTDSTVLIVGETGVGKEVVARALHDSSPRAGRPFVAVNCGALPESLVEAELFGHERGAFTGATHPALGFFRAANGGTLFLDEVGELAPPAQVKLLRAVQGREITPVGATAPQAVDIRLVAATNADIEIAAAAGRFRRDLLYRLDVVRIVVQPLRERREDIPRLAAHFIARLNARYRREVAGIAPEALVKLRGYDFPGNVRELENLIERAFALGVTREIASDDLPPLQSSLGEPAGAPRAAGASGIPTLEEAKDLLIDRALEAAGGNAEQAARMLGISSKTISRRRRKKDGGGG